MAGKYLGRERRLIHWGVDPSLKLSLDRVLIRMPNNCKFAKVCYLCDSKRQPECFFQSLISHVLKVA